MARKNYASIIIKIGSSTLTTENGELDLKNLKRIVAETAGLMRKGKKVLLVTSGAIVTGAQKLGIGKPKTIPQKQAAAAVGQSLLMRQYEKAFERFGIPTAQVLLTRDAIANPARYSNAKKCINTLLKEGVIPIVNENDVVAIDEIKIGDNDNLAAQTAKMTNANLLIILTDVDGFYMKDREGLPCLVPEIKEITREVKESAGHPTSRHGTGGMVTKIQAAEICTEAGIDLAIIHGRKKGLIQAVVNGAKVGTLFTAA